MVAQKKQIKKTELLRIEMKLLNNETKLQTEKKVQSICKLSLWVQRPVFTNR